MMIMSEQPTLIRHQRQSQKNSTHCGADTEYTTPSSPPSLGIFCPYTSTTTQLAAYHRLIGIMFLSVGVSFLPARNPWIKTVMSSTFQSLWIWGHSSSNSLLDSRLQSSSTCFSIVSLFAKAAIVAHDCAPSRMSLVPVKAEDAVSARPVANGVTRAGVCEGAIRAHPVAEGAVVGGHTGSAVGSCTKSEYAILGLEGAGAGLEQLPTDIDSPTAELVGVVAEGEGLVEVRDGPAPAASRVLESTGGTRRSSVSSRIRV